jgi:pyridoxamine 5'-phosphate oxidase
VTSTPDPILLFQQWFAAAHEVGLPEPAAATLATVSPEGQPSARTVLIRGFDARGFVFFTNLSSRKGRDLSRPEGARVALCFYWPPLARQIQVRGIAAPVTDAEADAYWATRPRGHQVAAHASSQSAPLPGGRRELEERFETLDRTLPPIGIPRPSYWSGFRVEPVEIEFWEGRENRLHDRLLYTRSGEAWIATILSP